MLSANEVIDLQRACVEESALESRRLEKIAEALRPELHPSSVNIPKDAQPEMLTYARKARTNYLPLVVDILVQSLRVVGFRGTESRENLAVWDIWQANGMDAKQAGLIRGAVAFGHSYGIVLPGDPVPVMVARSARKLTAMYVDPLDDMWPVYALDKVDASTNRLIDANHIYTISRSRDGRWAVTKEQEHGVGVCPVVRFRDRVDLDLDMPQGVVESLIPIQSRIDETVFGMLTAQHFGAFHQRWVTGWTAPKDANGNTKSLKSSAKNLWTFEDPDVKAGQFQASDLKGYIDSQQSGVRDIAAISQVPPQALLGQMANLSAEALAATEAGKDRRAAEIETSLGESFEQYLRLAANIAGSPAAAGDDSAQVRWADTTARSLAQVVDALGKMATMLGIPPQGLWDRVPDATDQDIAEWKALAESNDVLGQLAGQFARQADGIDS